MDVLAQVVPPGPSLPDAVQYFLLWWTVAVGVVAFLTGIRTLWRNGPGRRRLLARRLRQVVAGGQLEYVESMFGPAQRVEEPRQDVANWEPGVSIHSWISDEHILRCWVKNRVVTGWLVTSLSSKFRPTWLIGGTKIQLHRTLLADVGHGYTPDNAIYGANRFGYIEDATGGRPTWYQTVLIGVSESALLSFYGAILDALAPPAETIPRRIDQARQQTPCDTVSVHDQGFPGNPLGLMLYAADLGREQPRSVRLYEAQQWWRRRKT